ncbi:hypothetical protein Q3G72_001100 [Acer saccharum]|nr:hypothetical protein Q3G72_001100 [Acer saccharum]
MATMLGVGDLSPSIEVDAELREADTVRYNRSSSRVSQQQTTDDAEPSSVIVVDKSVPFAPSSVPAAAVVVVAHARRTRLRFLSSIRTGGHDAEQRSPVRESVPDHLERRFANVISAVKALREEVHKSDKERKESDRVKDEQNKELVRMIHTLQGTSTQMHTDEPFHYEAPGVMPQQGLDRQRNSADTSHKDTTLLPRMDSIPPLQ